DLPLRSIAARFTRDGSGVRLTGLVAEGDGFHADGELRLGSLDDSDAPLDVALRVRADRCEALPRLPLPGVLAIQRGRLAGELRGGGRMKRLLAGQWNGEFQLRDAEILPELQGGQPASPVALNAASLRFSADRGHWELVDAALATPTFELRGAGELDGFGTTRSPRLRLSGRLTSADAGATLNQVALSPEMQLAVTGGDLIAKFSLEGRMNSLRDAVATGTLSV